MGSRDGEGVSQGHMQQQGCTRCAVRGCWDLADQAGSQRGPLLCALSRLPCRPMESIQAGRVRPAASVCMVRVHLPLCPCASAHMCVRYCHVYSSVPLSGCRECKRGSSGPAMDSPANVRPGSRSARCSGSNSWTGGVALRCAWHLRLLPCKSIGVSCRRTPGLPLTTKDVFGTCREAGVRRVLGRGRVKGGGGNTGNSMAGRIGFSPGDACVTTTTTQAVALEVVEIRTGSTENAEARPSTCRQSSSRLVCASSDGQDSQLHPMFPPSTGDSLQESRSACRFPRAVGAQRPGRAGNTSSGNARYVLAHPRRRPMKRFKTAAVQAVSLPGEDLGKWKTWWKPLCNAHHRLVRASW